MPGVRKDLPGVAIDTEHPHSFTIPVDVEGVVAIEGVSVLIGGLPAARLGSLTVEVGPPATIVTGSNTVLIGGFPAARMGDLTSHGGVIIEGLPTVLIGG